MHFYSNMYKRQIQTFAIFPVKWHAKNEISFNIKYDTNWVIFISAAGNSYFY